MKKDYVFVQKKDHGHFFPNIYVIGKIYSYTMKKLFSGRTFGPTMALIRDGAMYWYASESGLSDISARGLKLAKENPDFIIRLRKKFDKVAPRMLAFTKKIFRSDLKNLSNQKLWKMIVGYLDKYENIYTLGEPVVLSLNDSLGDYLKQYLHNLADDGKKATGYFNLLISPPERSFVRKEEDELLEIAVRIKERKIDNQKAKELLESHAKKFYWVPYDYGVYLWDLKYFNAILKKMLKRPDIKKNISANRRYYQELPVKQKRLENDLGVDPHHRRLFSVMRNCAYLLDHKKEIFTQAHYHFSRVLEDLARRLNITKVLAQYYLPQELESALLKDKPVKREILERRYSLSLAYWHGKEVNILAGKAGEKFLNRFLKGKKSEIKYLTGIIASTGKYSGVVKVLRSAAEAGKVNDGDILVTAMTSPDYISAMRRSGAIITDEGGVMCHAAIVSRELGVPCVVGTRNATEILRDGDVVEVNANHNSVRILKQEPSSAVDL